MPIGLFFAALVFLIHLSHGDTLPNSGDSLMQGKFLDMHCHVAGIGAGGSGCFLSHEIRSSIKFPLYLKAFGVTEDELREKGDGLIVQRIADFLDSSRTVGAAVLLAMDGVIGPDGKLDSGHSQIFVPDSFVVSQIRNRPRLLYGASINPRRPDALRRLEQAKRDGAVLVKWIPSVQLFDPADSALIPFYRTLKKLGLPLLSHTGKESSFSTAKNEYCDPDRLVLALEQGVTVIAAHVATRGESEGQDNMLRLAALFNRYPNLYADISSLTQINKLGMMEKVLARPEFKHRLLYGTDYPLIQTHLVSAYYYPFKLSIRSIRNISALNNPWDQDVALKKALGVPEEVFLLSEKILLAKKTATPPPPAPTKKKARKKARIPL